MARLSRIIAPGLPHHVTQRGNRQQDIFFPDEDREARILIILESLENLLQRNVRPQKRGLKPRKNGDDE